MDSPAENDRTILVLDDDEVLRRSVTRTLQLDGFKVFGADNAHEAFAILDEHAASIDLVLCDLVLPRLSGREAANAMVARRPDIKILFMSGYSSHGSARQDLIHAGEPFLQKPFDVPELLAAIEALVPTESVC